MLFSSMAFSLADWFAVFDVHSINRPKYLQITVLSITELQLPLHEKKGAKGAKSHKIDIFHVFVQKLPMNRF